MAKSMTAYGRAEASVGGKNILIEIKSVNSRFLDCSVKAPRGYAFLEEKFKSAFPALGVSRGKIDVFVTIDVLEKDNEEISIDKVYTEKYINILRQLAEEYNLRDDISVMHVARNPEVFSTVSESLDVEKEWSEISPVFTSAVEQFNIARDREGENLKVDLIAKKNNLVKMAEKVSEKQGDSVEKYRERLYERVLQVLEENSIDVEPEKQRIITECAIFADKVAIDEELVRLSSHFDAFDKTICGSGPVGKRLDFLLQEMNREVNTMGSKVSDSSLTELVVDMKCELEKIREQIQNLE